MSMREHINFAITKLSFPFSSSQVTPYGGLLVRGQMLSIIDLEVTMRQWMDEIGDSLRTNLWMVKVSLYKEYGIAAAGWHSYEKACETLQAAHGIGAHHHALAVVTKHARKTGVDLGRSNPWRSAAAQLWERFHKAVPFTWPIIYKMI